jgi:hypothetical protein
MTGGEQYGAVNGGIIPICMVVLLSGVSYAAPLL